MFGGSGVSIGGGSGPIAIDTSSQIELSGGSGISIGGGSGPIAIDTSSQIELSGGSGISIGGGSGPIAIDTSSQIELSGGSGISIGGGSGPIELLTNSHINMSGVGGITVHSESEIALSTAGSHEGAAVSVRAGPSAYVQVGVPLYARPQTASQPAVVRHVHEPVASKQTSASLSLADLTSGLISVSSSSGSHHLTLPSRNQLWNGITAGDAIDFSIHLEYTGPSGLHPTTLSLSGAQNYYPSGLTDVIATHDASNIGRFTLRDNGSGLDLIRIG